MTPDSSKLNFRVVENSRYLKELLKSSEFRFDSKLRARLPEEPGIYRIFESGSDWTRTIRAGRTKTAIGGLRQRIYQNHYMGHQQGNLRSQLVASGRCIDLDLAKDFIRTNCNVQFLIIKDGDDRKWAEYYMLSVLRPEFSD